MRKTYIKPKTSSNKLLFEKHLLAGSEKRNLQGTYLGREADSSSWDEEEEEENTGGWFQ